MMAQSIQRRPLTVQKAKAGPQRTRVSSRKSVNITTGPTPGSDAVRGLQEEKDTCTFLDPKDIFFTNLILLGFDPLHYEEKYKIPFKRDMFEQNNRKGMEVVLYFLFNKLSPHRSKQTFKDCWPIFDKKQEQQFRKACSQWLGEIAKEDPTSKLPPIAASLLLTPGGTRFYQLVFYFSSYVIRMHLEKISGPGYVPECFSLPKNIPKDKSTRHIMARAIQSRIVMYQQKVLKLMEDWSKVNQDIREYASQLTAEYRQMTKKKREMEREFSSISEEMRDLAMKRLNLRMPPDQDSTEVRRNAEAAFEKDLAERSLNTERQWKMFEDIYQKTEKQRMVLDSFLGGKENEYKLKGDELVLKIPKQLLQNGDLMEKLGGVNTYEDGKLNLLAFVRLWKQSLVQLQDKLNQKSDCPKDWRPDAQEHLENLMRLHVNSEKKAEALHSEMVEVLEKLTKYVDESSAQIQESIGVKSGGFDLVSPSPVEVVAPSTSERKTEHYQSLILQDKDGSEEDAIESLTDSLSASVRERADKEHKERSCAVLAECTRVLGSATQPKPSRLPRRTVQPEAASTVKHVTIHSPQVEPSQLVWEESTKKDAEKHAPTTSKKRQSTQREIQDGVRLDDTLPNLPGTPGRSTMVSQTQPSTSTLVAHTTPLLSKVSAPVPESQASHKMKKSLTATSAARRINRPPAWNKPTLEAAHEILANEIVSDLVSVGAENSSVGSDRSRPQTPEIHAVADPVAAFGQEAFTTRDKLARTPPDIQASESPLQLKPPTQDSSLVLSGTPREVAPGSEDLMKLALLTSRTSRSPAKSLIQTPSRHDGSIHLEFQSGQLARSCSRSQPRNTSIDEKHLFSFGGSQPQSDRTVPTTSDINGQDAIHTSTDQIPREQLLYTAGETPPCIHANTDFNSFVSSSHKLNPKEQDEKDNSTPSHYSHSLPESPVDSLFSNHSTPILTPSFRVAQNPPLPLGADRSYSSEGSTSTPQNLPDEFLPSEPPTPFKDASMVDDRDVDQLSPAEDRQSVLSNASIISSLHGQQELSGIDSASSSPSLALTSISIPDNPSEVLFTAFSNTHHSILSSPVVSSEPLIQFTPAPPQRRGSGKRYSKLSDTNLFGGDVSNVDNTVEDLLTGTPRVGLQRRQPIITAMPSNVGGLSTGDFLTGTPRPAQHRSLPTSTTAARSTNEASTGNLLTVTPSPTQSGSLLTSTTAGSSTNETLSTVDLLTGTPRPAQSRLPPVSTVPSLSTEGGLHYPHGASVRNAQI